MAKVLRSLGGFCLFPAKPRISVFKTCLTTLQSRQSTRIRNLSTESYLIVKWNPFAWYNDKLTRRPLLTKSITAGVLYSLGDIIAQKVSMRGSKLDRPRVLRAVIYGTCIIAPLAHRHFAFIHWLVVEKIAVRTSLVPFVKVYFDQFVYWAPTVVALYHLSMGVMEGMNKEQCLERFKDLYWPSLKANWMIWAPMMLINYSFVPVPHQLNFCLMVGMLWATVISYLRARGVLIIEHHDEHTGTQSVKVIKQKAIEIEASPPMRVIYPEN